MKQQTFPFISGRKSSVVFLNSLPERMLTSSLVMLDEVIEIGFY